MSNNLVIVALPAEDDPIWKVSSEKKPHLTLCFLGDATANQNVDRIMLFVEHAVEIAARGPFYLEVDHRDELGVDKADVFMFRKDWSFKWINHFRNQLLQNADIKAAYESAEQFPEYHPHITLGYPATPAHEDKMPEHGIHMVRFDRIAVWTGDFEGPDWRLEWPEQDMFDEVAWGVDMDLERAAAGRYVLEHHGIKGMKWGVRTDRQGRDRFDPAGHSIKGDVARLMLLPPGANIPSAVRLGKRYGEAGNAHAAGKKAAKADKQWQKGLSDTKKAVEVHNKAADEVNRKLPAFNGDKRWKNADGTSIHLNHNAEKLNEYNRAAERELLNPAYANAAIAVHGATSPSGRYKFEIHDAAEGTLKVRDTTQVAHAAADDFDIEITLHILRDANGAIDGFEWPKDAAMAQTVDLVEEFMEHHGVKGMRWGQRKDQVASGARRAGRGLKRVGKNVYFETQWAHDTATHTVVSAASKNWSEKDVPRLNAQYKGTKAEGLKSRLKNPLDPKTIEYRSRSRAAYRDRLNEEVAKLPTNVSGTRKYVIADGGSTNANYNWRIKAVDVKRSSGLGHAAIDTKDDLLDFSVELTFDGDGLIIGFKQIPDTAMAQTAGYGESFVEGLLDNMMTHVGIKGMRWGVRKPPPAAVSPTATSRVPHGEKRKTKVDVKGGQNHPAHEDAIKVAEARAKLAKSGPAALSNHELRDVANRLQLENQVTVLTSSKGKRFVSRQLETESQRLTREGLQRGGKAAVKKAGKTAATAAATAALL